MSKSPDYCFQIEKVQESAPTFIGFRWILTAGHCLERKVPLTVQLGIRPDHTFEVNVQVNASSQRIHNGLNHNRLLYDIGENKKRLKNALENRTLGSQITDIRVLIPNQG